MNARSVGTKIIKRGDRCSVCGFQTNVECCIMLDGAVEPSDLAGSGCGPYLTISELDIALITRAVFLSQRVYYCEKNRAPERDMVVAFSPQYPLALDRSQWALKFLSPAAQSRSPFST